MIRPLYKLVNIETSEVLTYGDNNTTVFAGPWGNLQSEGKAVWQSNAPTLEEYKTIKIQEYSDLAFTKRSVLIPEYKLTNAALGVYEEAEKTSYLHTVEAFRTEFYRVKALIEVCVTKEEVDAITVNYPTVLIP